MTVNQIRMEFAIDHNSREPRMRVCAFALKRLKTANLNSHLADGCQSGMV